MNNDVCEKTYRDFDTFYDDFEHYIQSLSSENNAKLNKYRRELEVESFAKMSDWIKRHSVDTTPD